MKFNKITACTLAILSISTLAGCSSTSHFFRNRDFDYARQPVEQNKPLEVPKSVSTDPNIHPALVIPKGQTSFTKDELSQAQNAMLPPNFVSNYDVSAVEQKQLYIVSTKLNYDKDNQAKLVVYEPYAVTWLIVESALKDKLPNITLEKTDQDNSRFVVKDKASGESYYIFVAHVKNEFRRAELSLFNMDEKPAVTKAASSIVEQIQKSIEGQKVTEETLVNAQFGFINSENGLKFQLYTKDKVVSIVFVGNTGVIRKTLERALKDAGYKYVAYDAKEQTILFEDGKNRSYLLYLYPYTQNGSIFSDMSNWRNFFREEQKQLRVSLFDIKQVLIPVDKAKPILAAIASHIPLK
ncbi:hypothetical protein [Cysteiniphilum halobium]|uniref:hypothetical protein n=1 Tax=Cysteiniphilum halobium TaxID=2219059 RepID=UPI000E654C65|nr:hypothetical protein [Cysteiniphilum halobium]